MSRKVSFYILLAVVIVCAVIFYRVMAGFVLPLFLAALLVVIFKPLHVRMIRWCRGHNRWAALATTTAVVLIVLVPLAWVGTMAIGQGLSHLHQFKPEQFRAKIAKARQSVGLQMPFGTLLQSISDDFEWLEVDAVANAGNLQLIYDRRAERIEKLKTQLDTLNDSLRQIADHKLPAGTAPEVSVATAKSALETMEGIQQPLAQITKQQMHRGDIDYLTTLLNAQQSYGAMRTRLLGGPTLAVLRDFANPSDEDIAKARAWLFAQLRAWLPEITQTTLFALAKFLLGSCILVIAFYFFLADGPTMIQAFMRLSPLDDRYEAELIEQFVKTSRAVVLATLLSALAQAVLAGLGFWVAGVGSVFLLTMLTLLVALIPFVGATAVWIPVCLWLYFVEERTTASILLAIYGFGIISVADNLIKPMVLHGQSQMHPLLALLSVLGGVQVLGPIGILVGPMLVAFLQALLNMLKTEMDRMGSEEQQAATAPSGSS